MLLLFASTTNPLPSSCLSTLLTLVSELSDLCLLLLLLQRVCNCLSSYKWSIKQQWGGCFSAYSDQEVALLKPNQVRGYITFLAVTESRPIQLFHSWGVNTSRIMCASSVLFDIYTSPCLKAVCPLWMCTVPLICVLMGNTYFHVLKCTLGDVPGCIIFPFIPFTGPADSFLCVSLIKIKNLVCVIVL